MSKAAVIDELLRRNATFAAFRVPGQAALAYIQHGPGLVPANPGKRCFVLAPFETEDGPATGIQPDTELALGSEGISLDGLSQGPAATIRKLNPGLDRAGFHAAVRSTINAIHSGGLQKVVLARTVAAELAGISLGALFTAAAETLPAAFIAIANTERYGLWIGASPERLIHKHGYRIEVDALAGTMLTEAAPNDANEWKAKELDEQALVTQAVMATLARHGLMDLKTEGPRVKIAGNVAHLHTRITGSAAGIDSLELARALHPTPAVGGSPRREAVEMIRTLEPRSRSLYAGFWGPMDADIADLFVNIRCMEVFEEQALVHVGAGITADSDPDRECDEVERKSRTWLDLLDAQHRAG